MATTPFAEMKVSRRNFLRGGAMLTLLVTAGGVINVVRGEAIAQQLPEIPVNAWVKISAAGEVVIGFGSTEMGQGVMTSLPIILAEEMDADWSKVRVEQINTDPNKLYGNPKTGGILFTAGSSSVEGYFEIMRRAGANARRILIYSAAKAWDVVPTSVTTEPGYVVHSASGRRLSFGEVAMLPEIVSNVPEVRDSDLKPRSAYRLIGSGIERLDIPDKTRGAAIYSIDVKVEGMVYASTLEAPVEGERPVTIDDKAAKAVPGVIAVMPVDDAVAVVAEHWDIAVKARDLLVVEWSGDSPFRTANSETDRADVIEKSSDLKISGTAWAERGDAAGVLAAAGSKVIEADYFTEHTYHAQMEPLAAVAAVDADGKGAEAWIGTQSQSLSLLAAVQALETTPDRIRMNATLMGGGFGRRTFFARVQLRLALILSREVKRPVKVMWTREDDVKNGWFRPAPAQRMRALLDENGNLVAWHHRIVGPSILEFAAPQRWATAKGKDILVMEGTEIVDYSIPNLLAEHVLIPRKTRVSAWRGIGWGHNCFASECFIDELAEAANADPVEFRRRLLKGSPRGLAVLEAVLAMSNYCKPEAGRAHGLSFAGYKSTLGAGVAEVSVNQETGEIRVHKFWAAVDPGFAIQPKNLEAQVEGGIIFGLSGALKERIEIVNGEVQQNNFYDYDIMRINEIPEIHVQIVESGAAPSGAGEIGVPMTGGAVANAVWALTGKRLRHMPFTPERVKQVLTQ